MENTAKAPKITLEVADKWLDNTIQDKLFLSKDLTSSYDTARKLFVATENEVINTIMVSVYDKVGIYTDIRTAFTAEFGVECKFTNKHILKHIIKASFALFEADVSRELLSIKDNSDLLLDFSFMKWIIQDVETKKPLRADESLIKYIPNVLSNMTKIINQNSQKDVQKLYLYKGHKVTKTLLSEIVNNTDAMDALNSTLETIVKDYNEAFNINLIFNKAVKPYNKEMLVDFLNTINPDRLEKLLALEKLEMAEMASEEGEEIGA